jgi:hypothetical protein
VRQVQGWLLHLIADMNRRRLEFGEPIDDDGDAIQPEDVGAGGSLAQVHASAVGQSTNAAGGTCSTGQVMSTAVLLKHGFVTPQRDVGGKHEAVTSPSGNSGRIMMTPQATGTSTFVSCRRGMLTPLEHEMADEVHSPEEEQRFTHVSFRYYH